MLTKGSKEFIKALEVAQSEGEERWLMEWGFDRDYFYLFTAEIMPKSLVANVNLSGDPAQSFVGSIQTALQVGYMLRVLEEENRDNDETSKD